MNVEEALEIADKAIFDKTGKHLTDVQRSIFVGSLKDQEYKVIAQTCYREEQHVKNEGAKLWKLLSKALEEKVSKKNFQAAIERKKESNSTPTPSPEQETVFNEECDQQEDDIDVLVAEVRSHFQRELNKQCKSLELFDLFYNPLEVHLDEIYVDPNLNELKPFGVMGETQLWKQVVLENTNLIVLGCPGAGKTTLLKHIATHLDELNFPTQLIPIFIKLNSVHKIVDFESQTDFISCVIRKQYSKQYVSEDKLKLLLSQGRFILLLDGLDEVPQQYIDQIIEGIDLLKSSDYQENKLVISCRKEYEAYKSTRFTKFKQFQIKEFDLKSQIPQFVENWFNNASLLLKNDLSGKANLLIDKIQKNQGLKEIASTPLLLHLMCLVFLEKDDLPSKRSELYDEAINLMLKNWNKFKGCNHQTLSDSEIELVRKALTQIAAISFEQDRLDFEEHEVRHLLKDCPLSLSEIQVQSGLIVKQSWRKYAFPHKTFQEYLTAESIVNSCDPSSIEDQILNNFASHITEQRWREVFLLVIGMLPNAGCLLLILKTKVDRIIANEQKLQNVLAEIHKKSLSVETQYKSVFIRVLSFERSFNSIVLSIMFSNFNLSFFIPEDIDNNRKDTFFLLSNFFNVDFGTLKRKLLLDRFIFKRGNFVGLKREEIKEYLFYQWSPEEKCNYNKIKSELIKLEIATLKRTQVNISQKGWMRQYYESNIFLMECLRSNCSVSPEVREEIEETLLLPIEEIEKWKQQHRPNS
ncbi:NACHT domain-containing protein [Limnoraphis robusta Tam1]|uniref:NACHT domain-containing protein n=1 Tax=Limnoraphis robusta TaxID=1118279 RepID=UPI002B1FEE28|nr:NACHT domain-containing protein [Limnoraphis robusta]MEA5496516.1 NACHT domain-containing protein [Limnoraphis robusta BA-68 BA1]MEA5539773.1 NACHT domain-containing protein [Limnoraphis robusta Tam1]